MDRETWKAMKDYCVYSHPSYTGICELRKLHLCETKRKRCTFKSCDLLKVK